MVGPIFTRSMVNLSMFTLRNNKEKSQMGIVRLPILLFLLSVLGLLISVVIFIFHEQGKILIVSLFLVTSIPLGVYALSWRIKFDDKQFVYRNAFFFSRTYKYTDITAVRKDREDTLIYFGKRKIRIPIEAVGAAPFLKIVRRYRKQK